MEPAVNKRKWYRKKRKRISCYSILHRALVGMGFQTNFDEWDYMPVFRVIYWHPDLKDVVGVDDGDNGEMLVYHKDMYSPALIVNEPNRKAEDRKVYLFISKMIKGNEYLLDVSRKKKVNKIRSIAKRK